MTRAHALTQLLRLGPLTRAQVREITGWGDTKSRSHLCRLARLGVIERGPEGWQIRG